MPATTANSDNLARRVTALENESYKQKREQIDLLGEIRQHVAGLPFMQKDITELKEEIKKLNGTVRVNCDRLTRLESTSVRLDVAKISGYLIGAAGIFVAVLKLAGVF